jgi:putative PIN family toxin of toxin-antitoxin system
MNIPQVVIDSNVLVSATRSRWGASFRVLSLVDSGRFQINLSVPVVLEYEDLLSREAHALSPQDVANLLNYLCQLANCHRMHYLWRPYLKDPKDDMLLELAVAANCDGIVTYNRRDFHGVESFGVSAIEPVELLRMIGEMP